jgi:hypothetical protein
MYRNVIKESRLEKAWVPCRISPRRYIKEPAALPFRRAPCRRTCSACWGGPTTPTRVSATCGTPSLPPPRGSPRLRAPPRHPTQSLVRPQARAVTSGPITGNHYKDSRDLGAVEKWKPNPFRRALIEATQIDLAALAAEGADPHRVPRCRLPAPRPTHRRTYHREAPRVRES